ncbi:Serine/threonine-protein kinase [Ceratobasidium sp. AG-Ba]|nr:Serine/threonine-protein kinase [Ceratobasidium sp. AG-Ba]
MCDHTLVEEELQRYTATDFAAIEESDSLFLEYAGPKTSIRTKYLNKDVKTPMAVALKAFRYREEEDHTQELSNELRIWRLLSPDPNIAYFLGAGELDEWPFDKLSLVSRYYECGNSNVFLEKNDIPDLQRVHLLKDVLKGIVHIHGKSIVHGDLKGANILIENNGERAKISDFGSSLIECKCQGLAEVESGTFPWDAPERFVGGKVTPKSDIWAFGCVSLEILMDTPPYISISYVGVLNRMVKGDPPATPNEVNLDGMVRATVWSLMQDCWAFEPLKRPSATELLEKMEKIPTSVLGENV